MRTVDADLVTAMSGNNYHPYAKVICLVDVLTYETHDAIYYELEGTRCKVMFKKQSYVSCESFVIERGAIISGVETGLTTGTFYPLTATCEDEIVTLEGSLFKNVLHVSVQGDLQYNQVIAAVCIEYDKTAAFKDDTDAYWDYEFLEAGKFLDINNPDHFISILRQKYLLFAVDNGGEEVLFFYPGKTLTAGATDWEYNPDRLMYAAITTKRNMASTDESDNFTLAYAAGAPADYPRHNLGYIKSTESKPRLSYPAGTLIYQDLKYFKFIMRPDLRWQDGDSIYMSDYSLLSRILVKEIWNHKSSPTWRMEISAIQYFQGTEAGNMPASMLNVAPFIPLYTGEFDNILSDADTYVQHALDTLDDHDHDLDYAASDHNHDADYSAIDHNHDTDYAPLLTDTPCRYYLSADIASIPATQTVRIPLDTELYDLGSNWTNADWYGAAGNYTQADASGCSSTIIKKTGANFNAGILGTFVQWSSDAAGTLNTGSGWVTAYTNSNQVSIVKVTGANFANSYYFYMKKSFYVVPSDGLYLISCNMRIDPCEDQKRYNILPAELNGAWTTLGYEGIHASGTQGIIITCTVQTYLTAGMWVGLMISSGTASSYTLKGGAAAYYASYTSLAIVRVQ